VDDGDGGGAGVAGEGDVDLGGAAAVGAQVPEIGQPARRLPGQHLTPVVLDPDGGALEDPAARSRLEGHQQPRGGGQGVRTFTLAPGTDGTTRFTVREEYTGPSCP
jgi:hypothetical protein